MVILKLIILSVAIYISLLLISTSDGQLFKIVKSHNFTTALNQSTEISCITHKHLDGCIVESPIDQIYILNNSKKTKCFNKERICLYIDLHRHKCNIKFQNVNIQDIGVWRCAYYNILQESSNNAIKEDVLDISKRSNLLFFYSVTLSTLSNSDISNLHNTNIYVIPILSFCLFLLILIFPCLKNVLPYISQYPPAHFKDLVNNFIKSP